ncbi:Hypothetical protein A7982_03372 [Minicystis rosea]|nr:Hypothetical protein A7982_03372 [Minicystis rosea]
MRHVAPFGPHPGVSPSTARRAGSPHASQPACVLAETGRFFGMVR